MILVTGGTGFVGRSLTEALTQAGWEYKIFRGRIADSGDLRDELDGVDTVIHLASAESRNRLNLLEKVDVAGTERLLEECRSAGIRRIVVVSRLNANPNSHFALLKTKGRVERHTKDGGIPFTIIRSATLFGRDDRFLNVIAGLAAWSWPFVWVPSKGRVALQPLWVEDFARCIVLCLDNPEMIGQTIEVAGTERLRYIEIARQVLLTSGMKRITFSPGIKMVRPVSTLLFGWWRHPPMTRFTMDRFSIPEVAPADSVLRLFNFQPSRLGQRVAYLRRTHPGFHLFRLS